MSRSYPSLLAFLLLLTTWKPVLPQAALPVSLTAADTATLRVPLGTKVQMAATRPVWAAKAHTGDHLYLQTVFPVAIGNRIAIPAGTYVEGTITLIVQPTRKLDRAEIDVQFDQIIFADGYSVSIAPATNPQNPSPATQSQVMVQITRGNDVLLDNGTQIEMTLAAPLTLDAAKVAAAVPLSHAPAPGQFKPATLCRPTPGTAGTPGTMGTPDTTVPGTPGTPDTVIPGSNGSPDTVIPGTPAMPATVIPGTPGTPGTPDTPGTYCPLPPVVISSNPGVGPMVRPSVQAAKKSRIQDRGQP